MGYTKGPWKADRVFVNNAPDRIIVRVNKWKGETIADCGILSECNPDNAQLIAAAPELLEALEHLANSFKAICEDYDLNGNYVEALRAIDKAKGK